MPGMLSSPALEQHFYSFEIFRLLRQPLCSKIQLCDNKNLTGRFKARRASRCAACGLPGRQHLPFRTRVHHITQRGTSPCVIPNPDLIPRIPCSRSWDPALSEAPSWPCSWEEGKWCISPVRVHLRASCNPLRAPCGSHRRLLS